MTPISLIVTIYNRERFLSNTIESVLAQTWQNFELILWDDGSNDGSVEIARRYAQRDSRVKAIAAPHQGRVLALRHAVDQTQTPYFGLVDSDDLLAPNALKDTLAVLETYPDVGMVYTYHQVIDENSQILGLGHRCQIPYSKNRLLIDFMTFHFRLIRRTVYDRVGGFDSAFPCAQDYDLCLKLSEVTRICTLKRPLYFYRTHASSLSIQQQHQQLTCSQQAVQNALKRRQLDDRYELIVSANGTFVLHHKRPEGQPASTTKVFGIGLGRTGTTSLCTALNQLGYRALHLQADLSLLNRFDAAADTPVAVAFRTLDVRYPGSKFILTVRSLDVWLRSWEGHDRKVRQFTRNNLPDWVKQLRVQAFGQWQFDPAVWQTTYDRHLTQVLDYFQQRPQDLLVFRLCEGEGWETLCPFLGKPIPETPFPHDNKVADPLR